MVKDEDIINLNPIERIIRVGIGALLLYMGVEVPYIRVLYLSQCYKPGTIMSALTKIIASAPSTWQIFGWTLGFILIFTGANGFCPIYKILYINTNFKRNKNNQPKK
jgi:hypothetical protein